MKTIAKIFIILIAALGVSFAAQAKTLRLAYDADPVSLDPHEQLSGGTLQYSHMVFDPLVRWTKTMDFEPRLATSWKRIDK
jgi:peptide/nickel transport system substrate-binding protein